MSLSKKIKDEAVKDSSWLEKAKARRANREWLDISFKIAMKILKYLRDNNLTQKELADDLEFSPQYLSKVLKGKENLTIETITKIQRVINVELIQVPEFSFESTHSTDSFRDGLLPFFIEKSDLQFDYKAPMNSGEIEEVKVSNNQYAMAS